MRNLLLIFFRVDDTDLKVQLKSDSKKIYNDLKTVITDKQNVIK